MFFCFFIFISNIIQQFSLAQVDWIPTDALFYRGSWERVCLVSHLRILKSFCRWFYLLVVSSSKTIAQVVKQVRMNSLREYRDQYKRDALIRKEKAQKEKLPRSSPPVSESGFYSTTSEINEEDSISQLYKN